MKRPPAGSAAPRATSSATPPTRPRAGPARDGAHGRGVARRRGGGAEVDDDRAGGGGDARATPAEGVVVDAE